LLRSSDARANCQHGTQCQRHHTTCHAQSSQSEVKRSIAASCLKRDVENEISKQS
jgi:hypothetical protein